MHDAISIYRNMCYIYIYIYNTYIMRTMRIAENSFQANWLIKVMKL